MAIIVNLIVTAIAVIISAYLLPGVTVTGFMPALVVAILLAIINAFVRPVLLALTLPINVMTIGLFTFVLNALLVLLVSELVPGFRVDGFWWALLFSIILAIINGIIFSIV